jgi:hypothetical protein
MRAAATDERGNYQNKGGHCAPFLFLQTGDLVFGSSNVVHNLGRIPIWFQPSPLIEGIGTLLNRTS